MTHGYNIDAGSIIVSGAAGATGVGVAAKVGQAVNVASKATKFAAVVGSEVALDAANSAAYQLVAGAKLV